MITIYYKLKCLGTRGTDDVRLTTLGIDERFIDFIISHGGRILLFYLLALPPVAILELLRCDLTPVVNIIQNPNMDIMICFINNM